MPLKNALYDAIDSTSFGRSFLRARRERRHDRRVDLVLGASHEFIDRSRGHEKLCIVLAGYKEPLWAEVFGRLKAFVPEDVDVCIMTSGLVNEDLKAIAERNDWSYLSTSVNHLSHIQNIAIELHPEARWIYKIDEDMFLTEGFFETLLRTYEHVEAETPYEPAFVSPLINVSCYGHLRLLEKCDLLDDFRSLGLTSMKITDGLHHNTEVLQDPRVARYLWGESQQVLRDVDALNARFSAEPLDFTVCPVRYSIGAILFTRKSWQEFGGFPITFVGGDFGLGDDEEHICHYACFWGKAMIVSENSLVGHLGYGPQTKAMTAYYLDHPERFALSETEAVAL